MSSCTAADSLLGESERRAGAVVDRLYHEDRDETWLGTLMGVRKTPYWLMTTVAYVGNGPIPSDSAAWLGAQVGLSLFVGGKVAKSIPSGDSLPPISAVMNDTIPVTVDTVIVGKYRGPKQGTLLPITLKIPFGELIQVARAQRLQVNLGKQRYPISRDDLRDLRGVVGVALCTGARTE